jgi:hypothetical protein
VFGLKAPEEVGGFRLNDSTNFERSRPGEGYGLDYSQPGWKLDVFIYDLKRNAIPEDPKSAIGAPSSSARARCAMSATALCAISAIPLSSVATSPAPAPVTLLGAVACIGGLAGEPLLAQPLGPAPHRFFRRDILLHRYCALDALPLATGLKCFLLFGILDHNALLAKSARQNTSRQNQINLRGSK